MEALADILPLDERVCAMLNRRRNKEWGLRKACTCICEKLSMKRKLLSF